MPETSETQTRVNEASGTITTTTPATKPGWQTTEFYFGGIAMLISLAYASGLIAPDGTSAYARAIAFAAAALVSMGYSISRGSVKAASSK